MRGVKVKETPIPSQVRCDFHGGTFTPMRWNQRTCSRCAHEGAPDQSLLNGEAYHKAVDSYYRAQGRKRAQRTLRHRPSSTILRG